MKIENRDRSYRTVEGSYRHFRRRVEIGTRASAIRPREQLHSFFAGEVHSDFRELPPNARSVVVPIREEFFAKQIFVGALCNAWPLDVVHFPAFPPPLACFRPFIWTLHDATPWQYPETMDIKGRLYFQLFGARAVRSSRLIITVSHDSKERLSRTLPLPPGKIKVIYNGIDTSVFRKISDSGLLDAARRKYQLPEEFILVVGTVEPRKNVSVLLETYRQMRIEGTTKLGLVITGRDGWKMGSFGTRASPVDPQVLFTGFAPQGDLVALYNLAHMFVFPSIYEGFGLPPLEAMSCGCPAIVSNRGALPGIADDACLSVDPENPESLTRAISDLEASESLRRSLSCKGLERVRQFSWRTAPLQTLEAYREAFRIAGKEVFAGGQK